MADLLIKPIELIAEDARGLSDDAFSTAFGPTPKHELFAFRNLLVHDYDNIDYALAWDIVTNDIPELLESVPGINGVKEKLAELEDCLDPSSGDPLPKVFDGLAVDDGSASRDALGMDR